MIDWSRFNWEIHEGSVLLRVGGLVRAEISISGGAVLAPLWHLDEREFVYQQARAIWNWMERKRGSHGKTCEQDQQTEVCCEENLEPDKTEVVNILGIAREERE